MNIMDMGNKNPNFLGSWDLYDCNNNKIQVTIANVKVETVDGQRGKETVTTCYFVEKFKPMILNATNKKRLAKLFKTVDTEKYIGKRVEIGIEKVKAFGEVSDCLRISKDMIAQQTNIANEKCSKCGKDIISVNNMTSKQIADYTKSKFGVQLCSNCAHKVKEEEKNNVNE